jgi:hypothetical protein
MTIPRPTGKAGGAPTTRRLAVLAEPPPAGRCRAHAGDLLEDVLRGVIEDAVDRVEAQRIGVVLGEPVRRVAQHVAAHAVGVGAVVVDRAAPGRPVRVGEERRELLEVVALGADVVVDDVDDHREAVRVARIDERAQAAGTAVGRLRREQVHAVVAPVAAARKLGERHELDRGHAEPDEVRELRNHAGERALGRERADVQLVDHELALRDAAPRVVVPDERARIDDARRTVHAHRLAAAHRIGPVALAIDHVDVVGAGTGPAHDAVPHVTLATRQRRELAADLHGELAGARRPHAKAHAVGHDVRAELQIDRHRETTG